jgi:hypothetical protein
MTASTPDELIAGFPHSSLPKVIGEPTFEDLKVIRRLLNTTAMSVASYEGGGRHGHLGIIMTNEEYFAIAVDVFPVNTSGKAGAQISHLPLGEIMQYVCKPTWSTRLCLTSHSQSLINAKYKIPSNKLIVNRIVNNN